MKILFFCLCMCRCVRWISVGGLSTRYFFPLFSTYICLENEIFCILGEMSDYRSGEEWREKKKW